MGDTNEVVVQFKAVVEDFLGKLGVAQKGTQETTQKISSHLEGVGKGFEKMMHTLGAVSAILAGGAMFKEAIEQTLEWNGEVVKLARTLGITTEQSSGLAVALHHVGVSGDTYTQVAMKMTKQMRMNGAAFDTLGVATKDSNGEWRNTSEVMADAVEKLSHMEAGTNRNIAAQAMFGARVGDLGPLLRLNKELLEESAEKAKKYHLVVGPDGAAKTREYKDAMKDVALVTQSLQIQIGQALLPILLKLGEFLGESGPGMAEGFGYAIKGVIQIFYVLKAWIENLSIITMAFIMTLIEGWKMVGMVIYKVCTGDLKGAVQAAKDGATAIKQEWQAAADGITKSWSDMSKNSKELWTDAPKRVGKKPTGDTLGGDDLKGDKKEKPNLMGKWEAELQLQKAMLAESDGDLAELAKEDERKFWEGKLALTKKGSAEWVAVRMKMAEDGKAIQKVEEEEEKKAEKEKADLAKLTRQNEMDFAKNAVEVKKANLAAAVALGQITHKEELAELKKFHAEGLKIEIDALLAEQALHKEDPVKFAEIQSRILQAKRKSNLDIQKINTEAAKEEMKIWMQVGNAIQSSLSKALVSIITQTNSVSDALRNMFKTLTTSMVQMLVDMGLEWVRQMIMKKVMGKSVAAGEITAGAGTYAVNAMASVAAIPLTGWAMAPGVGAAALSEGMAMLGTIASAAGGFDIPAGMNPMTQLHEREMVLPQEHADTIRGLKGASGGMTVNIHAMDARSFKDALGRNQGGLLDVLKNAANNRRV